jgi:hypothetical protein
MLPVCEQREIYLAGDPFPVPMLEQFCAAPLDQSHITVVKTGSFI